MEGKIGGFERESRSEREVSKNSGWGWKKIRAQSHFIQWDGQEGGETPAGIRSRGAMETIFELGALAEDQLRV